MASGRILPHTRLLLKVVVDSGHDVKNMLLVDGASHVTRLSTLVM